MRITNFDPKILENAEKLSDGNPYTEVYKLNSDRIFKVIKKPVNNNLINLLGFRTFYKRFALKLMKADTLQDIPYLVLPDEMSVSDSGMVRGYSYMYDDTPDVRSFLDKNPTQDEIYKYFSNLLAMSEELHKRQIVTPDLITESNVLYDQSTDSIRLIDYDGIQIENVPTNSISRKLCFRNNRVLHSEKYLNRNGTYTTRIDDLAILVDFLFQLTKVNVAELPEIQELHVKETSGESLERTIDGIKESFSNMGLASSADDYISLFSGVKENPNPRKVLERVNSEFKKKYIK